MPRTGFFFGALSAQTWLCRVLLAVLVLSPAAAGVVKPPGSVIAHSYASSGVYLGSPTIAVLPSGVFIVACDTFGPASGENEEAIYSSADGGVTWTRLATLTGQYWSTLFLANGQLYIIGVSSSFRGKAGNQIVIRRSVDGGKTWSKPTDEASGLFPTVAKHLTAPVPAVVANGRIWRSIEVAEKGGISVAMLSASLDDDLLDTKSWRSSNKVQANEKWLPGLFLGWLEGNAVVSPDGELKNILRVNLPSADEKVAVLRISADGRQAEFNPDSGFQDFPGGGKKFTIRRDPRNGKYWALTNYVAPQYRAHNPERVRNTLVLITSDDLRGWNISRVVLADPAWAHRGFQYADWQFDGDDIVAAVRTAYDDDSGGARNQHDSNYIIFFRVKNYRSSK